MVYCIAARINAGEFLVVEPQAPFGFFSFLILEEAEKILKNYYSVMCATDVTAALYEQTKTKLLKVNPVIVKVPGTPIETLRTISKWRVGKMIYSCNEPIISKPHLIMPVKTGFIKEYKRVDVVQDIEERVKGNLRI